MVFLVLAWLFFIMTGNRNDRTLRGSSKLYTQELNFIVILKLGNTYVHLTEHKGIEILRGMRSNSYAIVCPAVRGDNPRAKARGLSPVQANKPW